MALIFAAANTLAASLCPRVISGSAIRQLTTEAHILFTRGHKREALPIIEQALALNPKNPVALGLKTQTLLALGLNEEALRMVPSTLSSKEILLLFRLMEATKSNGPKEILTPFFKHG